MKGKTRVWGRFEICQPRLRGTKTRAGKQSSSDQGIPLHTALFYGYASPDFSYGYWIASTKSEKHALKERLELMKELLSQARYWLERDVYTSSGSESVSFDHLSSMFNNQPLRERDGHIPLMHFWSELAYDRSRTACFCTSAGEVKSGLDYSKKFSLQQNQEFLSSEVSGWWIRTFREQVVYSHSPRQANIVKSKSSVTYDAPLLVPGKQERFELHIFRWISSLRIEPGGYQVVISGSQSSLFDERKSCEIRVCAIARRRKEKKTKDFCLLLNRKMSHQCSAKWVTTARLLLRCSACACMNGESVVLPSRDLTVIIGFQSGGIRRDLILAPIRLSLIGLWIENSHLDFRRTSEYKKASPLW